MANIPVNAPDSAKIAMTKGVGSVGGSLNMVSGSNSGGSVSPLVQNYTSYLTSKPFDNQKNYTSKPVTMATTATGINYGTPIGPVKPSTTTSSSGQTSGTTKPASSSGSGVDYNKLRQQLVDSGITDNKSLNAALAQQGLAPVNDTTKATPLPSGSLAGTVSNPVYNLLKGYGAGVQAAGPGKASLIGPTGEVRAVDANGNVVGPGNTVNMTPPGQTPQGQTPQGETPNDGSGGGGSGGGGGGGYSAAALLGQLGAGTGLTPLGTGTGTGTPYVPISTSAVNSADAAAAYAQLLKQSGYDLNQPLSNIALPNRVDLPKEVALPEGFNFQDAWDRAADVDIGRVDRVTTHPEEEMLGQIRDLQSQQAILSADNTVNNGIAELQRVMQDAQKQYQDQRNQIAMDEQRALDNQALYSEARGDRGGIGQAQYNTIQNTAATNRMTVQQEQTQLATDTARQIADLRSQGEFEKANQLLNISQKYLSELMDLYQWAKETNVSIDEFNLQVAQWEENFKLSLVGAELDADAFNLNVANAMIDQQNNLFNARFNQENSLFDARLNAAKLQNDEAAARLNAQLNAANAVGAFANGTPTYAAQQDAIANQLKERQLLADVGTTLIKEGIQPSAALLNAMGMGGMAASADTTGTLNNVLSQLGYSDASSALRAMGVGNAGFAGLSAAGITPEQYLAEAFGVPTSGLPTLNTGLAASGGDAMLSQLNGSYQEPSILDQLGLTNSASEVAAYSQPTVQQQSPGLLDQLGLSEYSQQPTYTDANVYAAFGADPETVLRSMGVGADGMAGLAYLGLSPAQFIGQAFGL